MIHMNRYRSHYGPLIRLGVPIMVGNIGHIVLSFADTLMIGHYGMKELAAASFINTLVILLIIFASCHAVKCVSCAPCPRAGRAKEYRQYKAVTG